jgi:peptidoglycan/LPS O-acetylase OafA/YrhL
MLKICFATIGAAACWAGLSAWGQAGAPTFAAYPVTSRYQGPGVAPQLRPGTAAWQFRTRIREAATQPPNFAGHYVLATWGCGAECVSYVIIDAKSGTVYFDDMTVCCWGTAVPVDFEPVHGRLDSRLLVFTGMLSEQGSNTAHYYTFSKGRLMAVPRPYCTK